MTLELRQKIINRFFSFGLYRSDPCQPDEVFHRVIGDPDKYADSDPFKSALIRRLYPSAVHAMVIKELTPPIVIENISSYEIFSFIRKPSTIFSMNVDGLAARYCNGHYLLEPHGRVPAKLIRSHYWDELINDLMEYGFNVPKIPNLLLPEPEPVHITSLKAYSNAVSLLQLSNIIIFIGYSFGFFRESFDDFETFEFFRQLLKDYRKDVLVLSPTPEFIKNAIEEATKSRNINLLPLYWNHLCQAIKETIITYQCKCFDKLKCCIKEILYRHDTLKDYTL